MVSFLAEVNIFSFWPKTMDYSKAFCRIFPVEPLSAHNSSLEGAIYEAEI